MAYFANGTEGMKFDAQCEKCRYCFKSCPVAWVQFEYNYEACNNETATKILECLIKNDGTCMMFQMDPEHFGLKEGICTK
jgi:ferredoxin